MNYPNKLKISIVGPGVVGQATGKAFLEKGFDVTFIGVNLKNINNLKREGYKAHLVSEFTNGNYDFDISFLTVPTPTIDKQIDLTALYTASVNLGKHLANMNKYHLVVVKSTVPPGTTDSLVIKVIEEYSKKRVGQDFGVCMNPEYLREKTALEDALEPWLILIGEYNKKSGDVLGVLYENFDGPIYKVGLVEAEMQKYIHNLFNAAKITFFNEMRQIGNQIGINCEKIFKLTTLSSEGLWNPKYGVRDKGPFSGSCLPKDTQAFLNWANQNGFKADLLKTVIEVNNKILLKIPEKNKVQLEKRSNSLPL